MQFNFICKTDSADYAVRNTVKLHMKYTIKFTKNILNIKMKPINIYETDHYHEI